MNERSASETTAREVRPRRSFIFSPGLRPEMFPKALASGADIVCSNAAWIDDKGSFLQPHLQGVTPPAKSAIVLCQAAQDRGPLVGGEILAHRQGLVHLQSPGMIATATQQAAELVRAVMKMKLAVLSKPN